MMMKKYANIFVCSIVCLFMSGCSSKTETPESTWKLTEEKAIVFSDGEYADQWQQDTFGFQDVYKLSDGTELMTVINPVGPENSLTAGQESFKDLSETAQDAIRDYYEEQGLLYDLTEELEKAYVKYQKCRESDTVYKSARIEQSVTPVSANESKMCFLTTVQLPGDGDTYEEYRSSAVFDRKTGKQMDVWDLFAVPKEEAEEALFAQITRESLKEDMRQALKPEYITFFPDNLEVFFPAGTLKSQKEGYGMGIGYAELKGILKEETVPDSN